uniref:Major outer membrane lipoprotein Lpp n=1 Tax=Photobacterium damsela subsp. piscicida TaxID=38294 RepID=Q8L1C4_PHODP|nr:lipoprotein [Photobacterium damselae subsp. piscicida]BAR72472.1 lipoprotein [eukaryotic synthetic construct]
MNRKVTILAGVILSATLMGCSSSSEMQQLTNKVDALSDQVSALQANRSTSGAVNDARAASDAAYQEAMRANQRIDNIRGSYTK